jgi:hypothetical protein
MPQPSSSAKKDRTRFLSDGDDEDASADCGCPSAKYILAAAILFWILRVVFMVLSGTER